MKYISITQLPSLGLKKIFLFVFFIEYSLFL